MDIKSLEKRYNKLVIKAISPELTEKEYEKTIEQIRELEIQMYKTSLN